MYAREARRDRDAPATFGVRRPVAVPPPSTDGRPSALSAPDNFIAEGPVGRLSRRYLGRKALPALALAGVAAGLVSGTFLASSSGRKEEARSAVAAAPPAVTAERAGPRPWGAGLVDRFEPVVPAKPSLADMPPPAMAVTEPALDAVPGKAPAAAKPQPAPVRDAARLDALVGRGDALMAAGEVAAARLFYERAFAEGDPRGAAGIARTYDESALKGLPGVALKGDPAEAARWKRRAAEAGGAAR